MFIRSLIIFELTVAFIATAYAQDPAVVNSKTIKVRFENDRVRVLEATLPPGVKEQVHSHPAYVIYVLEGARAPVARSVGWFDDLGRVRRDLEPQEAPRQQCEL